MRLRWRPFRRPRVLPRRPRLHAGPVYRHGVRLPGGFYASTGKGKRRKRPRRR